MNKKEFNKRWREMIEKIPSWNTPEKKGAYNCYVCESCGNIDKYVYCDTGVTPFITKCSRCYGFSQSTGMKDIIPFAKPNMQWYRPSLTATRLLSAGSQEHVLSGGLISRTILGCLSHYRVNRKQ